MEQARILSYCGAWSVSFKSQETPASSRLRGGFASVRKTGAQRYLRQFRHHVITRLSPDAETRLARLDSLNAFERPQAGHSTTQRDFDSPTCHLPITYKTSLLSRWFGGYVRLLVFPKEFGDRAGLGKRCLFNWTCE